MQPPNSFPVCVPGPPILIPVSAEPLEKRRPRRAAAQPLQESSGSPGGSGDRRPGLTGQHRLGAICRQAARTLTSVAAPRSSTPPSAPNWSPPPSTTTRTPNET
jgi:hypothetical protein